MHICSDCKSTLNKQLLDDKYPISTNEDIFAKLKDGKYFCKLDIKRAYLHLDVTEETAELQTSRRTLAIFESSDYFSE